MYICIYISSGYALKTIGLSLKLGRVCFKASSKTNVHSESVRYILVSFMCVSILTLLSERIMSSVASLQLMSMSSSTIMAPMYASTKLTSQIDVYFAVGGHTLCIPLHALFTTPLSTSFMYLPSAAL